LPVKIYYSLEDFSPVDNLVVTLGTFDGVHLGHRKLISRINEIARETGGQSLIMTFFPHPRMVLYPKEHAIELLNTSEEKIRLLEEAGIDHLVIQPFDREFSELSSEDFVRKVLVKKLKTSKLVIGYDHRFGKNREGSFEDLISLAPHHGFTVEKIPEEDVNHIAVSSTRIRNALKSGDVETAASYLGRPYTLTGIVKHGNKIGRTIGFPTANIHITENYKLIPGTGVYVGLVEVQHERHYAMVNIVNRPTIEQQGELRVEAYLIDFDREIYGSIITVSLLKRVRDDKKFASLDELTSQIKSDLVFTLNYIANFGKDKTYSGIIS
jgi:riboflavin kinase / FMN adenylyltransferase